MGRITSENRTEIKCITFYTTVWKIRSDQKDEIFSEDNGKFSFIRKLFFFASLCT